MKIPEQIAEIETRLKAKKIAVQDVCDGAMVNRATYQRWKSGETEPLWSTWMRFQNIVERYLSNADNPAPEAAP